jgi:hypothetical protein
MCQVGGEGAGWAKGCLWTPGCRGRGRASQWGGGEPNTGDCWADSPATICGTQSIKSARERPFSIVAGDIGPGGPHGSRGSRVVDGSMK